MRRYKTLLSNTLIFTISEFASKMLVFFMLPVYTRAMTTAEFGASDLINSSVGLLIPVFTLSVADGALRFAISRNADDKQVFSFGIKVILVGFSILLLALPIFLQFAVIKENLLLFYLLYITSAFRNYLNQFARGVNQINLVGISGVISTLVVATSNILLLLVFHFGVAGYLMSFVFGHFASSIVLFIGGGMHKYISTKCCEKQLKIEILKYSLPLAPNSLSWWLNNTANRYIIAAFCGVSQVGLFAAAARIPTILITIQGIFYQAWQLSAISEYEKDDKAEFFSKIYKCYSLIMVIGCSVIIAMVRIISGILFSGEFYSAWHYIPLLLVSVVFGALAGFLGSVYSASKQTRMLFVTTFIGGIVSVGVNYLLVPFWGPMGASAASIVAYMVVWLMRLIDSRKYIRLQISFLRDCFCYVLIIVQALVMIYLPSLVGYMGSAVLLCLIIIINRKTIFDLHCALKNFRKVERGAMSA